MRRLPSSMTLRLALGVRAANVHGDIVFMDMMRDRYSCVAASESSLLQSGLALSPPAWAHQLSLQPLMSAGLLTARRGAEPDAPMLPAPGRDLAGFEAPQPSLAPARDVAGVAAAAVRGLVQLKFGNPGGWLRHPHVPPASGSAMVELIDLALRFNEAAIFVPGLERCLPNSLALRAFLKRRGHDGRLVFGVRTHGFEAHCWVQCEDIVLNDSLAHCRWFTPIAWT